MLSSPKNPGEVKVGGAGQVEQIEPRGGRTFAGTAASSAVARASPALVFGEWLVMREVARAGATTLAMPLSRVEDVTRALRGALLCHAEDPPPAVLSGHASDGRPLVERPHVALLALPGPLGPGAGSRAIAGAAIVLPCDIDPDERQAVLLAAARWERSGLRLLLGRMGAMQLSRVDVPAAGSPLDPAHWLGPSRRWASVTPVALHHNPGDLTSRNPDKAARAARRAEEIITRGCAHVCLPRPTQVRVMRRSRIAGVPSAPEFMPFPRIAGRAKLRRVCVHVEMEFAQPVKGPVLLGAGRYFGVGLLRPCEG